MSPGVAADHRAVLQLFHHLRVSGRVLRIDEVVGGDPGHRLADAVAVTVVHNGHAAMLHQMVFEVVNVLRAGLRDRLAGPAAY